MKKLSPPTMACVIFVFCAAASIAAPAQTLTTLHMFAGYPSDGGVPNAGVVQATNGNFYGTTYTGGASNNCQGGCGTVFGITPGGALTTLHSFDWYDGASPTAALVQGTDGNFYGTTYGGGANQYYGTVFKITPSGTLTSLYSFCAQANCADGAMPYAGLVQATDGNFYGTTLEGGANTGCSLGSGSCGTVFKITPGGTLTTLHSFCAQAGCADGGNPYAGLVQASDGNFYGTTFERGANGYGTVFKITPSGTLTTLYSFGSQQNDGAMPFASLVQARDGNFYGTTSEAGGPHQSGTVFKITPAGVLTTLYNFCAQNNCIDGSGPLAPLVQASDGEFYGTTLHGGANCIPNSGCGTVFRITANGVLSTLYSFAGGSDGGEPLAGLVQATDGNFYGAATYGANPACTTGLRGCGTVFRLTGPPPSTTAVTSTPNPSTFGDTGDHHRDGWSFRTAAAHRHREFHFERNGHLRLHGRAAVVANGDVYDVDAGGGDRCDRGDLLGRQQLFRQQRHAHPDCESRAFTGAIRAAAALPCGGYAQPGWYVRRAGHRRAFLAFLPTVAERQSL